MQIGAESEMEPVKLEFGCFATILASVIEAYPRETCGLLGGEEMFTQIVLKMSPPMQSAVKRKDCVYFRNLKRYDEMEKVIESLGLALVGSFHSHPRGIAQLSDADLASGGISNLWHYITPDSHRLENWLELVVAIRKERYGRSFRPVASVDDEERRIAGNVKIGKHGYRYEMAGYWVANLEVSQEKADYIPTIREVARLRVSGFPDDGVFIDI